jgi:hypothetical protein
MDGAVALRELFLREDAAPPTHIGESSMVIAVSALLRELILAACAEPLNWDLNGRGYHLAELVPDEIARSTALPLICQCRRIPVYGVSWLRSGRVPNQVR